MDQSASAPETVKVILRVRPRIDTLPHHSQYPSIISNGRHDPDCVCIVGKHEVKLLPLNHCRCDACFDKTVALNVVAEKFGSGGREKKDKYFKVDFLYDPDSTQEDIYSSVADTVSSSVMGFNATIFAYGATGTGKTYTMTGTRSYPGIIPRVIEDVFRIIENTRQQSVGVMFHVELSYVEMYNAGFRNLLRQISDEVGRIEDNNGNTDTIHSELDGILQTGISEAAFEAGMMSKLPDLSHKLDKITVHESVSTGVFLCGPNIRIPVKSSMEAMRLFMIGNRLRSENGTRTNDASSRSHSVLTLHIESKITVSSGVEQPDNPEVTSSSARGRSNSRTGRAPTPSAVRSELRLGKIHLVDLAGSERLSESKAQGEIMTETQNINKSLLALGEVLHALALNASIQSKNQRRRTSSDGHGNKAPRVSFVSPAEIPSGEVHVPYFNSKLTHLLKDSLGGNSKTVMIANIGSETDQYHHHLHSLTYATRAMKVRNLVHVNRVEIGDSEIIPDLANERDVINQLKERLVPRGAGARPLPRYPSINRPARADGGSAPSSGSVAGAGSLTGRSPTPPSSNQSVLSANSFANQTRRSKSAFGSPNKVPMGKSYTLKLQNIRAEQLNYVSFPLCPVLKFRVDKQESATSKNLYSRAVATFPESFEFEVNVLKYKAGLDLEVEAVNVSPLSGELIPIGEGRVDMQSAISQLGAQKILTIELLNSFNQPSGLVLIGAILLDRPVGTSVSYPNVQHANGTHGAQTPFSPPSSRAALIEYNPKTGSDVKNAVFKVDRIVCNDLLPPAPSSSPMTKASFSNGTPAKVEYSVVVQVGNESLRTEPAAGKAKNNRIYAAYDRPMMMFDVDYDELPSETIHVAVFEVPAPPTSAKQPKNCIGKAKAPLFSLIGRNDGIYTPASEFAMQLKDENGAPAGKVSLFLLFSKNNANELQIDTARVLFDSPVKSGSRSPTKHLRSVGMSPRLNNIRVPSTFHTGWIRISSIVATSLNKFRLVGNTARYKHLRDAPMTPVPAYLKHSELLGKQDPFVVVEAGEFWGSYSKVLLNQGWNCLWDQVAFCCYLSNLEASEQDMKITVYDRSCSGYHNVFIGFASVPLVNFFAPQRTNESCLELSVVDRRGKVNGKLELKYSWEACDEKERWQHGIITKVCGDGCYDIKYDDGDEECAVFKDVIRLLARSGAAMPAKRVGSGFDGGLFHIPEGTSVEVNDRGRGMWFPARVVRDNGDDTYDLDSSYEISKFSVSADLVRRADEDSPPRHNASFSRKLTFEASVVSGGRRSKYKLRDTVEGNFKSKGTWYVGKIFKVHYYDQYCTYDIDYLTGEFETEVDEKMIRFESTRYAPEDASSAYDLRQLRAQRSESNVVNPLHRTGAFAGLNSAAAGRNGADSERTKSKFQAGERVEVNYRGHGKYYSGIVEVDYENGLYDILYFNEAEERDIDVAEDLIRSPADADNDEGESPEEKKRQAILSGLYKFEVGDRVEANFREIGKFIPGIITRDRGQGVFDVHYYDGRNESKVHFELIRLADPNAYFSPSKRSKYSVGQSVESNCEGLGVWYHALIRNVLPDDVYNIQYDDGETEYDVSGAMLRAGGAYSPGIPSLKPFFRVGDRVKVACRSSEVEHEMRSLSAMKQRIMEERKKLAEGKLAVAKRGAMIDTAKAGALVAHRGLEGFKDRVGYSGELTCCQAEDKDRASAGDSPTFATGVSAGSFRKLEEIESAFAAPLESRSTDVDPTETLNDAVTKAIVVEQSLGNLAKASKEEELSKALNAFQLSVIEKEKADELALSRAMDEAKARKRNNFSKADELKAFHEAYLKAELELGHIMAARQLVLEQDEALKIAKQKADLEAKSIAGAQRKGEKATARLREEDRARLASGQFPQKDTRPRHNAKAKESSSQRVQRFLGPEVSRDRDALRMALVRVKEADDELSAAKSRAEQAGLEYAAADAAAQTVAKDLQGVIDSNLKAEQTLTEDSLRTPEYAEYRNAVQAIGSYSTQARNKGNAKMANVHKAEVATASRLKKEEAAAVAGEKRTFAEESMILAARNGDLETAKSAMREANVHGEHQGNEVLSASIASKSEATELAAAKFFAGEEKKMYSTAKEIAVLAAGLLRVIIADQREREYLALEDAKNAAQGLLTEIADLQELITERDAKRVITTEATQTESLAIEHIKGRLTEYHRTETHVATMEKTTISLKVLKAHNGRCDAEHELRGYSKDRAAFEERARLAGKKCAIEESVAQTCAFDDAERDGPVERFASPSKKEVLHHFSTYSPEECKAVRMATAHAEEQFNALDEVKTLALMEIDAIDSCRRYAEDEFSALSLLASLERNELHSLVDSQTVSAFQQQLAESKSRAIDANRGLYLANQRAAEKKKELQAAKDSTMEVLDALAMAQGVTQHVTPKDFGIDRNKVSAVEGAQHASKAALVKAVVAEKARLVSETTAENAQADADGASVRAAASDRLRHREEESAHQATLASSEGISMREDDSELQIALIAAIVHCDAQLDALYEATNSVEREIDGLIDARAHAVEERRALMLALSKEETILLLKSQRDQQKADAMLAIAKKLLDGRIVLVSDAQNGLEREALALDVAIINLERAARQLVARGDDDIAQFRAYQKEFKRLQCKKLKAAEARQRRDAVNAKAQVTRKARESEEHGALAMEEKVYECEQAAVLADQKHDNEAQVKALREARRLSDECTAALDAAKEYAAAEEELDLEAQHECEEERKGLSSARAHADECYRLLAKALSVLPLQHNTPMGLVLLNGGDPFFKGVPVRPRKRGPSNNDDYLDVDPSKLRPGCADTGLVNGNTVLRAADFKIDDLLDSDSKELNFQFEANPRKAALRAAQDDVERALEFLDAAKGRTEDAEKRYRAANAAATLEGKALGEVEENNAATTRRLYSNFVGVEKEFAQLQKVRSDLNFEDKTVATLKSAKESEVKKVSPHAQNRQLFEDAAREAALQRAVAEEEVRNARKAKDNQRLDAALVEAKKFCDAQANALNEAAQAAAKECSVWSNGTTAANKELASAEKAHDLADEEARLLALIRAAQLNQGKEAFQAAQRQAEAAKDNYDATARGMDGFANLIDELGAANDEREAELTDETKSTPMFRGFKEVRARFEAERKRAQASHEYHDQEVAKALAARKLKDQGEQQALGMEEKRLQAEAAVDAAALKGDKAAETRLTDEAKKCEAGVGAAYGSGTQSALAEAAAWRAAVLSLETEKDALTAAHAESLDATGLLVNMRGDQIQRELGSLNDAKQLALDCANGYEAANKRAVAAAAALERSRTMLNARAASLGEEITSLPAYNEYLDLVDGMVSADDQANHFMDEKLAERAEVDVLIAAKEQDEQAALAAGTQRALAEAAMRKAQNHDDTEAEAHAIEDLKNFSDDQEKALLSAKGHAVEEANKWGVATDLANEEAQSRIVGKDHANAALKLLNRLKLEQERQELEAKKVQTSEAEGTYRKVRKQVAEAKSKTAALVEKSKMSPGSISDEVLDSPEFDKYQHRAQMVATDANRPVIDHDIINGAEIARAKALGESRKREEASAVATAERRTPVERTAADLQKRGDLEKESTAVGDVNALVESEEKSLLTATQNSQDELSIWLNLKNLSDNELKAAISLNERAEEAARLLAELMLCEKGRLAEATVAAIDQAVQAYNHYVVMNKKTLARSATLTLTIAKSDAFAKTLSEPCKASPEFHTYESLLAQNIPVAAEARIIKTEKESLVADAEGVKLKRVALELAKPANSGTKPLNRGSSVRELAAKFDTNTGKNSRTAQLSESETEALTALYNTALEENAAWERATECTIREKEAYSVSNTLYEQTVLAVSAAKSNQRERYIASELAAAEDAAHSAEALFYQACAEVEQKEAELANYLSRNDELEAEVVAHDSDSQSAPALLRAKERVHKEQARAAAARATREAVVVQATALADSRVCEVSAAEVNAKKLRRVIVGESLAEEPSARDSVLAMQFPAALTRMDILVCDVNKKAKTISTEDVPDADATSSVTAIDTGDVITWVSVRAVFPDFGAGKRQNLSVDPNMQDLAKEQEAALSEEQSLDKATHHAIDEEQTWRLAQQHALAELEALSNACAKADETARVLDSLKDDINTQHKAMLDAACADAEDEAQRFNTADGDCSRLAQIYTQKKALIGDKDSALAVDCKSTADYVDFEHIMGQLKDSDEPAISAARQSKGTAVSKAQQFAAKKRAELEKAASAGKGGLETEEKMARTSAFDFANQETAAWDVAQQRAANEADALNAGISHEDQALGLLDKMRATYDSDLLGEAEAEAAGSKGKYDSAFALAARKQAEFEQERGRMNAKEAEISPDSRGTATYKKFHKLRTELLDEDEPFILSKRTAKLASAKRADVLVVANKRQKATMETVAGEKAAWDEAGALAMEEVGGLDIGIDKSKRAQELLGQVQIEELNRLSNQEEMDLREANRRALEAAAELEAMNRKIFEKRAHLSDMKDECEEMAARVLKKGPEFSGDVAAHRRTMQSVDQAVAAADVFKLQKDAEVANAEKESAAAQRLLQAQPAADDNSHEAAALRRNSLVDARGHAVSELEFYKVAKLRAESEHAELSRAEAVAKGGQDSLDEAGTTRAYRSRLGYLLLGGEEGLIDIPKRRPFDTVKQENVQRPIDFTKMKKSGKHNDCEHERPNRRAMVATEVSADDYGDDSRDPKVLFELGGGWASALQHHLKKTSPYQSPPAEEYMPHVTMPRDVTVVTKGRKTKSQVGNGGLFRQQSSVDGQEVEQLRGKALFIALVKHIIQMGRVVRLLKPLGEGELEVLKERITASEDAVVNTSNFLEDTTMLQSKAGRALLMEDHDNVLVQGPGSPQRSDESSIHVERAVSRISSGIESFLQNIETKEAMVVEYSETSTKTSTSDVTSSPSAKGKKSLKSLVKTVTNANKLAGASRVPASAGAEVSQFKPAQQVDNAQIMSFLFGGMAVQTVDAAVLDDEGEDIVETVKETTVNTTSTVEKSQRQTVEETHTEETEVAEVTTVIAGNAAQPRMEAAKAPAAPESPVGPSPAAPVKNTTDRPRSGKSGAANDSSEFDEFGSGYDGGFDAPEEEELDTFSDLPSKPSSASPVVPNSSPRAPESFSTANESRSGKSSKSGDKGLKKVGSSSSVTSGGSSKNSKKRSGGSRAADNALMQEMMSGNLDF